MAYTTPTTHVAGETLPAADYNVIVNDVIALAAGPVSHTSAAYAWNSWNPTNITGTDTNAPSTALRSYSNSTYFTLANASGTLTVTFLVAGYYEIGLTMTLSASNPFSVFRGTTTLGGTCTQYYAGDARVSAEPAGDVDNSTGAIFSVLATANQTLTILPRFNVTGSGTVANFTALSSMFANYLGA